MVLCPCIVAGTEDKYLLVQKDSYMGRVTYTYYQTQQGDDYDRMAALFEEPTLLTTAASKRGRSRRSPTFWKAVPSGKGREPGPPPL